MQTVLVGRFVCAETKTWSSFTDDEGKTVEGGSSTKFFMLSNDGTGDQLLEVRVPAGPLLDKIRQLTFGVEVQALAVAKAYRSSLKLNLLDISLPGAKAA